MKHDKRKYEDDFDDDKFLRWQRRLCIITCSVVIIVALAILFYVINVHMDMKDRTEYEVVALNDSTHVTSQATTRVPAEEPSEPPTEAPTQATTEAPTEPPTEPQPEPIENLQDNLSSWFMERHQDTSLLTIWKRSDNEGNLLVAVRSEDGQTLVTFRFDRGEYEKEEYQFKEEENKVHQFKWLTESYEEWTQCTNLCSVTSAHEIVDATFVGYREVSGNYLPNVQFQVRVLFNRLKSDGFPDDINAVITEKGQYACKTAVENRRLKSDSYLEEDDLEACFRAVLLSYAGEEVYELPENVVYAATGKNGSGTWGTVNGTIYCYE